MKMIRKNLESNNVRIGGIINEPLKISNIDGGKNFYETTVSIEREYEYKKDYIPLIFSKKINNSGIKKGTPVYVRGEIRKYKVRDEEKKIVSKTCIFAYEVLVLDDIFEEINEVTIKGTIIDEPYFKEIYNKKYVTFAIEVPRKYNHSDYISVFAVGFNSKMIGDKIQIGDKIEIFGRIQSKYDFNKNKNFQHVFVKKIKKID